MGLKKRKKKELMQGEIWYIPAEAQYYCSYCELHPKAEYLALEHRSVNKPSTNYSHTIYDKHKGIF